MNQRMLLTIWAVVWLSWANPCVWAGDAKEALLEQDVAAILEFAPGASFGYDNETIVKVISIYLSTHRNLPTDKQVLLLERRAWANRLADRPKDAIEDFDKIIKLLPNDPKFALARFYCLYSKKNPQAEALLEPLLKKYPKYAPARTILAMTCRQKNDLDAAFTNANLSLQWDNTFADGYEIRAVCYLAKMEYSKAIKDIDDSLKRPHFFPVYMPPSDLIRLKAAGLLGLSRYEMALRAVSDAKDCVLTEKVEPIECACYMGLGRFNAALLVSKKLLQADDTVPDNWGRLAFVLAALGKLDDAQLAAKECARLTPAADFVLGAVAFVRGEDAVALKHFDSAIKLDAKNQFAVAMKSLLLSSASDQKVRNGKRALEIATTLCKYSSEKIPRFELIRASAYAECGEYDKAIKIATAAKDSYGLPKRTVEIYSKIIERLKGHQPLRKQEVVLLISELLQPLRIGR